MHILLSQTIGIIILISTLLVLPLNKAAIANTSGEILFKDHCAGCHINGGNIIRRGKTLKLKALKRNNLNSPDDIAKIARDGIGIMSGYKEVLAEGEDQVVARWIWDQAQNAWVHG